MLFFLLELAEGGTFFSFEKRTKGDDTNRLEDTIIYGQERCIETTSGR